MKMNQVSAAEASKVLDRSYQIQSRLNELVRSIPLEHAEKMLAMCEEHCAKAMEQ